MTVRDPFLFLAGSVPLDFVNTELMGSDGPTDLLVEPADLLRWITESGLGRGARLQVRAEDLVEAKALRADLRRTFLHLAAGGKLRSSDLAPLNRHLGLITGALALGLHDGAARLDFAPIGKLSATFLIARAAAEFFAGSDLSLVKSCEGTGCILLFHDTTKNHKRRWCSMAVCGNRSKAAAHYRRSRAL